MKPISEFNHAIRFVLTDIDDTLTTDGQLTAEAYQALWRLHDHHIQVIPITGRPAGWCEMIARLWPVAGVVGENGGFYFRYHQNKMNRFYFASDKEIAANRPKLDSIQQEILKKVPGSAVASDQFCRLLDLAIDFCEDVPKLDKQKVQSIVDIFKQHGAQAKVSSIHVNGWFGQYDKLTQTLNFLQREFSVDSAQAKNICTFVGDSPNDEPMWQFFPHGMAVANISKFISELAHKPTYVASKPGGAGFVEIAERIISTK